MNTSWSTGDNFDFTITSNALYGNTTTTGSWEPAVKQHDVNAEPVSGEVDTKALASGTISVDESKGIVEAFAAAIGNKDSVGDIILPGAFNQSLSRRKPRVVWGHNWNEPVGKVLDISEVGPGDHRLPKKMRDAGVGGLFVKVQFNLNTERGREAFETVKFFGEEQEWSIGYKTIDANYDPVQGANLLKEVELYEVSPVLHGANQLTGTVSVKSDPIEPNPIAWEEGEIQEKSPMRGSMVGRALSSVLKSPIRIRHTDGNNIVYDTPAGGPFLTTVTIGSNEMKFTKPRAVRMRVMVEPVEDKPAGGCGGSCGGKCGGKEADIPETETIEVQEKVGRMVAGRTMSKLRQVVELLQSVIEEGSPPEPAEGPIERKKKTLGESYLKTIEGATVSTAIVGKSDELSGLLLRVNTSSVDEVAEMLNSLNSFITKGDVVAKAPTQKGMDGGVSTLDLYVVGDEQLSITMSEKIHNVLLADHEVSVEFDALSFYGVTTKTLNEVFFAK